MKYFGIVTWVLAGVSASGGAPSPLQPVRGLRIHPGPLATTRPAETARPFTVAGEYGATFGEQSGSFAAWLYPVKILSDFQITAEFADYPAPIDLSPLAATIEVMPAMTSITDSHAAFTIKERMFAARGGGFQATVVFTW